jgi:hypothetical protein
MHTEFWYEDFKGIGQTGDLVIDEWILLKLLFMTCGVNV